MKRHVIKVFLWILLIVLFGGCAKKDPIIARIGKKSVITLSEFNTFYAERSMGKNIKTETLEGLKKYLNDMIDREILLAEAYKAGMEQDSVIIEKMNKTRRELLLNKLYNVEIVNKVFPESLIRDYYARTGKEFMLRSIVLNVPKSATPEEEEKIRSRGEEILGKIKSGENFIELVKQYSDDIANRDRGGLAGPFVWEQPDDPIMKVAFSLKEGKTSGLIKTNRGYTIIYVDEIHKKKRGSYKDEQGNILEKFRKESQNKLTKAVKSFREKLLLKKALSWNEPLLDTLAVHFKNFGFLRKGALLDSLTHFLTDDQVLITYRGGQFTIKELKSKLEEQMPAHFQFDFGDKEKVKKLATDLIFTDSLIDLAYRKSLDRDRFVLNGLKRKMEVEMMNLFRGKNIYGEIIPSEQELVNFFKTQQQNGKYVVLGKIQIQEVLVKDKKLAENIYKWAKEGRSFDELAKQYTTRAGYKQKKGVFDYFSKGKWGKLGDAAFKLKVGQIGGPIQLERNLGYSVFKVLDKKPDKAKSFEQVKGRVNRDLIMEMEREKEKAWQNDQRELYQVKIYDEVLESIVKNDTV